MRKVIFVKGLSQLERLEATCSPQVFKYAVHNCSWRLGRKPMAMQIKSELRPDVIVRGTVHTTIVCELLPGEIIPEHLPVASIGYF